MTTTALTPLQLEVLAFERTPWKYLAAKETAIGDWFGISGTRYSQILNTTLDQPAAETYDPDLVRRLRRIRETRTAARSRRRIGATA